MADERKCSYCGGPLELRNGWLVCVKKLTRRCDVAAWKPKEKGAGHE